MEYTQLDSYEVLSKLPCIHARPFSQHCRLVGARLALFLSEVLPSCFAGDSMWSHLVSCLTTRMKADVPDRGSLNSVIFVAHLDLPHLKR